MGHSWVTPRKVFPSAVNFLPCAVNFLAPRTACPRELDSPRIHRSDSPRRTVKSEFHPPFTVKPTAVFSRRRDLVRLTLWHSAPASLLSSSVLAHPHCLRPHGRKVLVEQQPDGGCNWAAMRSGSSARIESSTNDVFSYSNRHSTVLSRRVSLINTPGFYGW